MSEPGYVYRQPAASAEGLRSLLAQARQPYGWLWSPTNFHKFDNETSQVEAMMEGRVSFPEYEVRWRQAAGRFDVLILAVAEQALAGFEPLTPPGGAWRLGDPLDNYRLRQFSEQPGEKDEFITARPFLAPDGSAQFIALIGSARKREERQR